MSRERRKSQKCGLRLFFAGSQILHKKISTHLLTVLIISVILQLEQREEQKGSKKKSFRKVPIKVPEIKNEPLQIDKFLKER